MACINERNCKMVFLAVNQYKYDKVTERHIDKMAFDIKSIYGDDVLFTITLRILNNCDFAYFEHDWKKHERCKKLWQRCQQEGITCVVEEVDKPIINLNLEDII